MSGGLAFGQLGVVLTCERWMDGRKRRPGDRRQTDRHGGGVGAVETLTRRWVSTKDIKGRGDREIEATKRREKKPVDME